MKGSEFSSRVSICRGGGVISLNLVWIRLYAKLMSFSTQYMELLNSTVNELPIQKLYHFFSQPLSKDTNFLSQSNTVFYLTYLLVRWFSRLQNSDNLSWFCSIWGLRRASLQNINCNSIAHIQIQRRLSASVPLLALYCRFNYLNLFSVLSIEEGEFLERWFEMGDLRALNISVFPVHFLLLVH